MKRQQRWLLLGSTLVLGWSGPILAQTSPVTEAARPLDDGLPEVAITRLRELLRRPLPNDEWCAGATRLAQGLIETGEAEKALPLLQDARLKDSTSATFWRAQALAALGRFRDALPLYQETANNASSPDQRAATFGSGQMLRSLGKSDDALRQLRRLFPDKEWSDRAQLCAAEIYLDRSNSAEARRCLAAAHPEDTAGRQTRRYLEARIEIVEHHPERALQILEPALKKTEGAPPALVLAMLFSVSDLHLALKTPETGDDFLEDFIEHRPNDSGLSRVFAKLDELYRAERKPARNQLERWIREPEQPRRALAQWYLARLELRAGRRERAYRLLGDLRSSHLDNEGIAPALVEFADIEMEDGRTAEALSVLSEARALWPSQPLLDRIDLMIAQAHYTAGSTEQATEGFERVGYSDSKFADTSIFNGAIGRLKLDHKSQFEADYAQLKKAAPGSEIPAELRLEQSLSDAAKGDQRATQSLRDFTREFSNDPRVSEAWVALAELAFHHAPPDVDEAERSLAQARQSHPTSNALERADYLSIWLEDSRGNDAKVVDLATQFLKNHPNSSLAAEVRMKLAETYFRRQDFSNAQTNFELLAQQNPNNPLAEKALFFAGESAMSSMGENSLDRAVSLFNQVVQLKGDLRWTARNEQATIERKLGKPQNALLLYEEVIKSDARPADKREALCGRGDIYFELGSADSKNYALAAAAYDDLVREAPDAGHWRNQALFKKALCLEKTADRAGALSIFYDILEKQSRGDRPPELFWFYKAGFDAARLLEEDQKWASAAAIYKKLIAVAGPRSDEAGARLNRLRLEHFLWEE